VETTGNLFAQQESNRRKSRWLVVGFVLFFAWLGFGGDWLMYEATRHPPANHFHHVVPWFGVLVGGIAAVVAWWAWAKGPQSILWATGARQVTAPANPSEQQLVNVVEEMAIAAGVPRPSIYVIDDRDPNAFATGHDPSTSSIAVTTGLLAICNRDELQGVIGHEIGHVKNLDVRLMTLMAGLVGAVALISNGLARTMFWNSGNRSSRQLSEESKSDLGPVFFVLLALYVVSWILAPIITQLLAFGVSRDREYLADAMSAQFTRNPSALAAALDKINRADIPSSVIKGGAAHLCIADPLGRSASEKEGWLADRLASHPPMAIRIARLKAMAFQAQKQAGTGVASA
jgi:heat shock protein HtpX